VLAETVASAARAREPQIGAVPRIVTFAPRRARYVRVALEPRGLETSGVSIRTLSVADSSAPAIDLALRKHVAASSVALRHSTKDNPAVPASAVDGNPGTGWAPAPNDDRPWLQLDLGESASFDQVCIVLNAHDPSGLALRISVSDDGAQWIEPASAEDLFLGSRIDVGATVPPCSADCQPLHVQADPATWQVYAVNHTAVPILGASLSARIYEPFGRQLSHIEQQDMLLEPLSVAAGFVVARPAYFPPAHLVSLQLHDAGGVLLSERNCWRYRAEESPRGTASRIS
jgi:hypothetical protein